MLFRAVSNTPFGITFELVRLEFAATITARTRHQQKAMNSRRFVGGSLNQLAELRGVAVTPTGCCSQ